MRVLGAGFDRTGLFINVRFLDRTTNRDQRIDVTSSELIALSRSFLSALEIVEQERARTVLSKQQQQAS